MSTYAEAAIAKITFTGNNGAGYISVPGVKVGDMLVVVANGANPPTPSGFNVIVDTADSIYQQNGADWSALSFTGAIIRVP